ncbi:TetR/AcrR family transcriptional regulator [Actinoalloteichus hymeniacidonis]|uniref:Transcriptional regulator, TetR family n=1 Tax=Actinoalloteichus hymeniacidonis TaxID=340345 RepID=A0AAC9HSC4_9PSEU|nr:TetR/AcrR family transcriptional regulator [Actinoalloteichus hymeniacidonis]AOS64717.1 transcriptional regulator, TetR family [Actinoalloteichus hymeniacidonis]MBB5907207.1 AcrR family transcriptional regulator [Actinoalloteichus hymeniacidonis]
MADDSGTTPTRTRNRRGEGGRLRDEIVAAATELLDETGDESAITLRSVARRAGIAAPSIYRHFPDQPNIMLAVVQQIFAELAAKLHVAAAEAGDDPRRRLFAVCDCYLDYAQQRPGRYRVMFGGVWMPALSETSVTADDMAALGDECMGLLGTVLGECVAAGYSTSNDLAVDTVALWLGLHGLAHQRAVTVAFPWPQDIAERVITSLAHLE